MAAVLQGHEKLAKHYQKRMPSNPLCLPWRSHRSIRCRLGRRARLFFSSYLTKRKRSEPSRPFIKRALRVLMDRAVNQMKREAINSADEAHVRVPPVVFDGLKSNCGGGRQRDDQCCSDRGKD